MSPRKIASQELTKEIILQNARSQFVEKGFQQVSMRSIAKLLHCSHGAIYYYFKNKAELFYAIVEDDFSELNNRLEETIQGSEDDSAKLYNVLIRFIEFGLNHQSQYEIMFLLRNTEVDSLSQVAADQSYQKFAQTIQSLSKKRLENVDVWSAFLALHGFVSHYFGYVDDFEEAKSAAELHVNFIIKGLNG
ncbi:TetR/AcrR family transcriptional regulator [Listeria seeligeri]|uniref:TetR/AcrR family transcriptional regulator n=1 Tax=Listeria seeligeri TaxID=1640 RepID=UPI0018879A72|nr:TetR/AcrR family transcriptional regulator [Listeria seeligeri]MBF2545512.1 TetR/AcrR family transcriptional regulator [Listeria seeligeri]MBF2642680.1 TetR/AcrR family transcriptional regulator [Listeria seeligeri]QPJ27134.1 TetR/AcrR family transcriptional regulator [Listeria seeligeri]